MVPQPGIRTCETFSHISGSVQREIAPDGSWIEEKSNRLTRTEKIHHLLEIEERVSAGECCMIVLKAIRVALCS